MKKLILLVSAIILIVPLFGCSEKVETAPEVAPPVDDAGNPPDTGTPEETL